VSQLAIFANMAIFATFHSNESGNFCHLSAAWSTDPWAATRVASMSIRAAGLPTPVHARTATLAHEYLPCLVQLGGDQMRDDAPDQPGSTVSSRIEWRIGASAGEARRLHGPWEQR
jgi:hypothetical protein